MKRFQFSVSGLLALTVVVAMVLSLRGGLTSDSPPYTLWLASFLLSYWRSSNTGWSQVARATITTGVVWGAVILCAYGLFLGRRGGPRLGELVLHGLVVISAAALVAFTIACLVEGARSFVLYLFRAPRSRSVISALSLLVLIPLTWAACTATRLDYWEPTVTDSAGITSHVPLSCLHGGRLQSQLEYAYVVGSDDGRFLAAILNGQQKAVVIDVATRQYVARFGTENDEWFGDITFYPDSKGLAALLYSRTGGPRLVRWDALSWSQREPVQLDDYLRPSKGHDGVSLALDRRLLVVYAGVEEEEAVDVQIHLADLCEDPLRLRPFGSARIESRELPQQRGASTVFDPRGWLISANGRRVATSAPWAHVIPDYLFSAQGHATKLRGRAIGFAFDTECLAVHERSVGFCWWRKQPVPLTPPFWDYLRLGERSRVSIYDCCDQEVVAQSRWFADLKQPCMTPDGSQVSAEGPDCVLLWNLAEVGPNSTKVPSF